MKHCEKCGVQLHDDDTHCPLCGSGALPGAPSEPDSDRLLDPVESNKAGSSGNNTDIPLYPNDLTESEQSRIIVELISVAAGIAFSVSILADLFTSHSLSWSLYSSAGIIAAWLFSAMPILLHRKPWVLFVVLAPSLVLLLFLLDVFNGRLDWFLGYGLPIVLSLESCTLVSGVLITIQKRHGLNTVAVILAAVAVFCFLLEYIIDWNLSRNFSPDWSVIVNFTLIPTAALLFYLHYRIMHRASLRKLFRL